MANKPSWITSEEKLDEVCKYLPLKFKNGESVAEVCCDLGIARSTFYENIKKHPKLNEAYELGKLHSEAWWQKLGRAGAAGKVKIQPAVFIANMNNRFNWGENMRLDHQSSDGSMTPKAYSPEQYAEAEGKLNGSLDDLD